MNLFKHSALIGAVIATSSIFTGCTTTPQASEDTTTQPVTEATSTADTTANPSTESVAGLATPANGTDEANAQPVDANQAPSDVQN